MEVRGEGEVDREAHPARNVEERLDPRRPEVERTTGGDPLGQRRQHLRRSGQVLQNSARHHQVELQPSGEVAQVGHVAELDIRSDVSSSPVVVVDHRDRAAERSPGQDKGRDGAISTAEVEDRQRAGRPAVWGVGGDPASQSSGIVHRDGVWCGAVVVAAVEPVEGIAGWESVDPAGPAP